MGILDATIQSILKAPAPKANVLPSGMTNSPFGGYLQQLNDAQNAANTANDTRFKQAASLYGDLGTSNATDIARYTAGAKADSLQSLNRRGLGNSTVVDAMNLGIDRNASGMTQKANESVAASLADLLGKKEDAGVNPALFSEMIRSANSAPSGRTQLPTQYFGANGQQYGSMGGAYSGSSNFGGSSFGDNNANFANTLSKQAHSYNPNDLLVRGNGKPVEPQSQSSPLNPYNNPAPPALKNPQRVILNGVPHTFDGTNWVPEQQPEQDFEYTM